MELKEYCGIVEFMSQNLDISIIKENAIILGLVLVHNQ